MSYLRTQWHQTTHPGRTHPRGFQHLPYLYSQGDIVRRLSRHVPCPLRPTSLRNDRPPGPTLQGKEPLGSQQRCQDRGVMEDLIHRRRGNRGPGCLRASPKISTPGVASPKQSTPKVRSPKVPAPEATQLDSGQSQESAAQKEGQGHCHRLDSQPHRDQWQQHRRRARSLSGLLGGHGRLQETYHLGRGRGVAASSRASSRDFRKEAGMGIDTSSQPTPGYAPTKDLSGAGSSAYLRRTIPPASAGISRKTGTT